MAELKDDFDFNTLDPDRWENLCFALLHARNPLVRRVNGHGGDEGIDAYVGPFETPAVIYQFKYFKNSFGKTQVRQVKNSLDTVLAKRCGFKWILMCSKDPTPEAMRVLDGLRDEHSDIDIEYHFVSEIAAMLVECPKVRKEFYPNTQDQLEAISLQAGNRPIDMIRNGMKRLNNVVCDDRFQATVITDGNATTMVYTAKPGVTEEIPLFNVRAKSKVGFAALMALQREGKPFTLSSNDIELEPLISLPDDEGKYVSVSAFSTPDKHPSTLLLYAGDANNGAPFLYVTLKTVRLGTEVGVRSNADQKECPIIIELEYPVSIDIEAATAPNLRVDFTPRYEGHTVKTALKGARFLAELAESRRLSVCSPYGDPEDASYCAVTDLDADDTWERQATFFEALLRVCQFFGINPTIDSSCRTEEFFDGLAYFTRKLEMKDRSWSGTLSFTLVDYKKDIMRPSGNECAFVIDETPFLDICGIHCEARVRYVSKGKLKSKEKAGALICEIVGEHTIYMDKVLP
ncbi:restriction endonuclease [uncultured Senegalimassilia sp.]|uniref:restriction endonuclease n=1 Tax=uncultured Senegalimassilia sp. TaxID=1714350 RepID=UPI0027DB971E|nr:restriction endonuclease [uncultured Senegalimassilia sp.]